MRRRPRTDRFACPVCGMDSEFDIRPCEYNGSEYFFCSEQCRERFADRPALFSGHKASGHAPLCKRRSLRLTSPLTGEQRSAVTELTNVMMGVRRLDVRERRLTIEYDLLQATLAQIETRLTAIGVPLSRSVLDRLKSAWWHEREETELDNLSLPSRPCCNRSPRGR